MTEGLLLAAKVVGVAAGVPLVSGAFGAAVLRRFTRLGAEERFACGFGLGLAAFALCAFLGFVLHAPQPYFNLGAVGLMLGAALLCRLGSPRPEEDAAPLGPIIALFVLGYLHLVCLQALLPAYRGSDWYYDWWMHYDEACVFVGAGPLDTTWANGYTLASRTPLFNLATAFVMGLGGSDFATYQLASALPNCCFILALYLLLRDLFGRQTARLALLLAPLNLWMMHNAWFTWPKMLAAFYLVLGLHFYLRSLRYRVAEPGRGAEYAFCFGVSSLLAFMTHQVSLVYVVPLLLHAAGMALRDRAYRPGLRELLSGVLVVLAVAGPWYAWLAVTLGTDRITGSTPVTLGDESARFRPAAVAGWMAFGIKHSVVPYGIGEALADGQPDPVELYRGLTQLYFSLLTGAVTLSLTAYLLAVGVLRLARGDRRAGGVSPRSLSPVADAPGSPIPRGAPAAVGLFVGVGTLGAAFLHPGKIPWGIAHSAAFPTALVLAALGWGLLARARRAALALVCGGMVLEFLLMFWSHHWLLFHDPEILEAGSGAVGPRTRSAFLLNEALGGGDWVFLAGAVLVQLLLVLLLAGFVRRREWRKEAA